MSASLQPHFTPAFFQFLRQLAKHNSPEWFKDHKAEYEQHVKGPMLRFIADLRPRIAKISTHIEVDPKLVGGSMQRMNRDTRFSKDKSPYKTSVGAMFGHDVGSGKELKLGYHLSLAPDKGGEREAGKASGTKAYVGIWEPDAKALDAIRTRIMVKPDEWKKAVGARFAASHTFEGESLKRPPKVGDCAVDPSHPLIDELKRKSHAAAAAFDEKTVCAPDFLDEYVEAVKAGSPLMAFLCGALKLPYEMGGPSLPTPPTTPA